MQLEQARDDEHLDIEPVARPEDVDEVGLGRPAERHDDVADDVLPDQLAQPVVSAEHRHRKQVRVVRLGRGVGETDGVQPVAAIVEQRAHEMCPDLARAQD